MGNNDYINDVYNGVITEISVLRVLAVKEYRSNLRTVFLLIGSQEPVKEDINVDSYLILNIDLSRAKTYDFNYLVIDMLVVGENTKNAFKALLFVDVNNGIKVVSYDYEDCVSITFSLLIINNARENPEVCKLIGEATIGSVAEMKSRTLEIPCLPSQIILIPSQRTIIIK
ncbi:hypothetical protein [Vulcanisaeta souniana]|uniref:Uncharacterized protein n=1 Tax=Vulcanisaeta souniana JCM 11219 TaxID=1293586 RepID=A0A830EBL9_9CREN|nr:hypothetical protein [Vulcanisaeta souniana]BDR93027.1 hypothetical protein Vsou_21200 [Vulcanisaeta souniana JCM 11219]GGI83494.1 hypothetical protein GCM10007112_20340 [Vulcanisaeta souniana JCM 11219]